jgi:tetratricopeptide (TPR) repeat protein
MTRSFHKLCLAALGLLCALLVGKAVVTQSATETLDGYVRDSQRRPVAQVKVWLDDQVEGRTQSSATDANGHFRFNSLAASTYMLRAQKPGYQDATQGPISLHLGETASVNLQLVEVPSALTATGKSAAQAMEYSDEPNFTVAGVSDPSDVGGHGSNVTLPTKEALAKDTASLAKTDSINKNETLRELPKVAADNFEGNLKAGRDLVELNRASKALPYLERAFSLKPQDINAGYWLALACLETGDLKRADTLTVGLLNQEDTGDVHALMAQIKEAEGQPLEAAKEYQRAAEIEPSEPHLFSWGAELLLHHAYEPASEVFAKGHRLYPKSSRILVGLGTVAYAQDLHDQAARWFLEASALHPSDPGPYLFLGEVQEVAKSEPQEWVDAFRRFAALQPENARAHYYYAVALEKQRRGSADFLARETQLNAAIALDSRFGEAYLHLGLLQAEQHNYPKAVESLQKAVALTPLPDEAHLRLAQVYREMGETEKARKESQLYNEVSVKKKGQLEQERHELGQLIYTLPGETAPPEKPVPKP